MRSLVLMIAIVTGACGGKKDEASCGAVATRLFTLAREDLGSAKVDDAYLIPDAEAVTVIYELLQHEGLCLGGSTGINVAGAMRLAKQLGPGKTIVTVLCDSGSRYQSKLFNADFMRAKSLPVPEWLEKRSNIKLPFV